ncbi:MAG: M20 family metallopeptidase [Spirochaetota bacterium]
MEYTINGPINAERLREVFCQLVNIYSPSGKEEEILEYLSNYLMQQNFSVIHQPVDEKRYNLLVVPPDVHVQVLFLAHVDTVPALDLDSYEFAQTDDLVTGLGTADMKGGCAAILEAFLAYYEKNNTLPPAALGLVVGEEENGDGTEVLLREYSYPWAIVGEPTDLVPCTEHYGYLEVELQTYGFRRHASLADSEHNAISKMLRILSKITTYLDSWSRDIIYNIRDVQSSSAGYSVPDRCNCWLDLHISPSHSIDEIEKKLQDIAASAVSQNKSSNPAEQRKNYYFFSEKFAGYRLPDGLLMQLLKEIYGRLGIRWRNGSFRSHSDANLLWAAGTKPLILGPGQLARAHTQGESISFSQVLLASRIYFDLLNRSPQTVEEIRP